MGKSIAIGFACAAFVILMGSFMAPRTVAADNNAQCAPAYGIDPCEVTGAIPAK